MTSNKRQRELMELAVLTMDQSVPEPRHDGKPSPVVGALLLKPDGRVETASRGELRHGDHAEYTLLERKNRDAKLDGGVLFTTLEPCAPGARHFPKLSCAERIVLARIKEVWVGIEDPDPLVDRKGIKYLQENGVDVHIFDSDLQDIIRKKNKEFIAQAENRAAKAKGKKVQPIVLSRLEAAVSVTAFADFQKEAIDGYRRVASGTGKGDSDEVFHRRLISHGLAAQHSGQLVPTGFGLVLFGKEPRTHMVQAGLLGTIHYGDGTEETRDFDGPAVGVPALAIQWLKDKLPNPIERTEAKRREVNQTLYELLREGIVNALVHRDYSIEGAKCQLVVSPDRIVVMSPGLPVEPITLEQLQAFDAPMLSRNPVLHFIFARMELAEERGLGLKSLRSRAKEAGLPLPSFSYRAPYIVLTLYREANAAMDSGILGQLTASEQAGWNWLATQETVTTSQYQAALGLPNRTAKNHLKRLAELGLLEMAGAGRATHYRVLRP